MDVFFPKKRFYFIVIILASVFSGACFSGCSLVEKWRNPDSKRSAPNDTLFNNSRANDVGQNEPRVDLERVSQSTVNGTNSEAIQAVLNSPELTAQWETLRKQTETQVTEIQQQAQRQTDQLSSEIARLQRELDAKEQKVQSMNASFQRQATVIIPEKSPLKFTPVFSMEGITVLPRDGETLRIAVDDSFIFYPHAMQLLPTADAILSTVVKEIRANYPEQKIGIEAHADPILDNPQNPMLILESTTRKANTVATRLLDQNRINPKNLIIVGHGASKPLPRETSANNNRIEFVVYP